MLLGCTSPNRDADNDAPSVPAALHVGDVSIDALGAPRDDNPLIAGEDVRLGARIHGGTPPLALRLEAVLVGARPGPVAPIDARHELTTGAAELALAAPLDMRATSGVYRLRATVTDARGQSATAESGDFTLIGSDAETAPAPAPPPFIEVTDVAGRRRRSFVRGERVTVHAELPGESSARLTLRDPRGVVLATSEQRLTSGGLRLPIDIPRLAQDGAHEVHVRGTRGTETRAALVVTGMPFAPATELVIDGMSLYGGKDQRARRAGLLTRGEPLTVEIRVGGVRVAASATLRIYTPAGALLSETALGRAELAHPEPRGRVYIQGAWRVPPDITPGRYQLQAEAIENDHVTIRYREVLVL